MQKLTYFGDIDEQGKLKIHNNRGFINDLRELSGKKIRLTLERAAKRSNPQNNYFHGVVIPIIRQGLLDAGWLEARSPEWVKDFIKFNCLIKEYHNEQTGEVFKSLGKTSELTTSEFMDMIADIQKWSIEFLNIYVPDPGEVLELDLS